MRALDLGPLVGFAEVFEQGSEKVVHTEDTETKGTRLHWR
jgi:hypothetical protein